MMIDRVGNGLFGFLRAVAVVWRRRRRDLVHGQPRACVALAARRTALRGACNGPRDLCAAFRGRCAPGGEAGSGRRE
jgi:hypothetical protein